MSVKEAIQRWIEEEPEDSPTLLNLYEKLRHDHLIPDSKPDLARRGVLSAEELESRWQERRARRKKK